MLKLILFGLLCGLIAQLFRSLRTRDAESKTDTWIDPSKAVDSEFEVTKPPDPDAQEADPESGRPTDKE